MVFFQGSLQEGIAAALQQAKSVVCFVTDGEAESRLWEDDFLAEEEVRSLLESQSVTLRLVAGSQEEGYLKQLYPLPKKPTVVIIRNAELKEYIAAGVAKEDFVRRMKAALTPSQPAAPQPQPAASAAPPSQANDPPSSSSEQVASSSSSNDDRVQALLAERAAKLAEKKKLEEEEAKRQRAEKAKAKAEAEASGPKKTDEQSKHMEALRKKQREEREERQRILKAIEDDKAARRARRAAAEAERRAAAAPEKPESAPFAPASQVYPSTGRLSEHCALQVRLFDGSTIRSRFSSDETLKDVRRWVDETRGDGREPYTFKVLLTPLPSRKIDVAEEDRSLRSLDLTPSATLILVRVPRYTAAHAAAGAPVAQAQGGGVFQRLVAFVLAIINGSFGTIAALFSSFFSTSGPATLTTTEPAASSQTTQRQAGAASARRRGGRIAGLDHADERRNDQQFYNGNSTNFEPRPDDGE